MSSPLDTIGAIAGGIGGLAVGFKDWITSPIPSHTLEKQFDKVATASAQELGGIAFDAATGLVTAYIGGRAVEWVGEKWVSAKGTAGTPVTKGPCCFAAGTKVSTPQGDRVIESLKVGDVVWSKPEKGGKPFAAAILATHQRSDQPIYRLKLKSVRGAGAAEGETLLVTPSHPFYVPAKRDFIPVKDLEPGDLLQSLADGDTENTSSEVESLELYLPEGKTYNLTVDVGHTFYVGELKTWVHNTGPCDLPPDYFAGGEKASGGAAGKVDEFIPPGMDRPFRSVNPEFPPSKSVVDAMESPQIKNMVDCSRTDCSDIASKLFDASGGKGTVIEVRPARAGDLNVYENGVKEPGQFYHQVYTDGRYVYDPRLSSNPIPKGDWEQHIKNINPGGVSISDRLKGLK